VVNNEDKRAVAGWERAQNAYQHYVEYLERKADKHALTITDLVYVKNFKGGSAIIGEPPGTIGSKLAQYESSLRAAQAKPAFRKRLEALDEKEFRDAQATMHEFAGLPAKAHIDGFGVSFTTALMHFFFPAVVPILDRRALNGARIAGVKVDSQGQVTNLLELYPQLIAYTWERLRADSSLTLRSLDRQLFTQKLGTKFKER
jgi:hypothetical protein